MDNQPDDQRRSAEPEEREDNDKRQRDPQRFLLLLQLIQLIAAQADDLALVTAQALQPEEDEDRDADEHDADAEAGECAY